MRVDISARFLRLSKERQQVAAVCYRMRKRGIEFLLVQTRGGRWIFPKGGAEPGMTYAQSAALEAFEEAGVHGRMEEIAFTRYYRRPGDADHSGAAPPVMAYLCEVTRQEAPREKSRTPTWFSPEQATERLRENRAPEFGFELARVIDRALSRIHRRHVGVRESGYFGRPTHFGAKDGLQQVRFEAAEIGKALPPIASELQSSLRTMAQIGAPIAVRRTFFQLGMGENDGRDENEKDSPVRETRKVTAIDGTTKVRLVKRGDLPTRKPKS